jgi:sugar phosphate isomerase/epimerase
MKICFSTLACPEWDVARILDAASENQIRGIDFRGIGSEIDVTKTADFTVRLEQTLAELRRRGLEMPCLNTSVTLVTAAPERWQMMLDECQRYAGLAEKTGTKFLRVFGGAVPKEMTRDEGRNLAKRHLRQIVKICQPHGCMPLLETHDDWSRSDEVRELLSELQPTDVGVLWDLEHPYRKGEKPLDAARGVERYLKHVHIKDSVRVEPKNSPRLLGEGTLPLGELLGALKAVNYDGWICLETEKRWHPEAPDPEVSIPQFANWMRGHWG